MTECGQRREQKSDVGLDVAGNEFGLSSVTGRGAGLCCSGVTSMMVCLASALKVTRSTSYSTPQVSGGGWDVPSSGARRNLVCDVLEWTALLLVN